MLTQSKAKKSIAATYCIHHDEVWLRQSVESIYPVVDSIVFLLNAQPWNGPKEDNSSTKRSIEALADPERKIIIINGYWSDQVTQRNFGLAYLKNMGFDYQMVVDADEVYETNDLRQALDKVFSTEKIDVWHLHWLTYWKSQYYRIDPPELYYPPIFMRVDRAKFVEYRNAVGTMHELISPDLCFIHHLSYARSDELVLRKIRSISAAPLIIPNWYENVWKAWDKNPKLRNLHPTNPPQFQCAIPVDPKSLPTVIRNENTTTRNITTEITEAEKRDRIQIYGVEKIIEKKLDLSQS